MADVDDVQEVLNTLRTASVVNERSATRGMVAEQN